MCTYIQDGRFIRFDTTGFSTSSQIPVGSTTKEVMALPMFLRYSHDLTDMLSVYLGYKYQSFKADGLGHDHIRLFSVSGISGIGFGAAEFNENKLKYNEGELGVRIGIGSLTLVPYIGKRSQRFEYTYADRELLLLSSAYSQIYEQYVFSAGTQGYYGGLQLEFDLSDQFSVWLEYGKMPKQTDTIEYYPLTFSYTQSVTSLSSPGLVSGSFEAQQTRFTISSERYGLGIKIKAGQGSVFMGYKAEQFTTTYADHIKISSTSLVGNVTPFPTGARLSDLAIWGEEKSFTAGGITMGFEVAIDLVEKDS